MNRKVFRADPGAEFVLAAQVPHDWYSVRIPFSVLGRTARVVPDDAGLAGSRVVRASENVLVRLMSVIGRFIEAARLEPAVLTTPASRNAAQNDVLAACLPIVGAKPDPDNVLGRPSIPRKWIVRAVNDAIEEHPDLSLRVEELASIVDVSVRTLRNAVQKIYGVSPSRYLKIRRLNLVRSALLRAEADGGTTVTSLAAQYGIWEFGRFALDYRRLFGELPSTTLQRVRRECHHPSGNAKRR